MSTAIATVPVVLPGASPAEIGVMREAAAAFAARFGGAGGTAVRFAVLAEPHGLPPADGRAYCMHCTACGQHHVSSAPAAARAAYEVIQPGSVHVNPD